MQDKIRFGTDGWRAVVNKDFNLKNVAIVAQAISDYFLRTTHHAPRTTKIAVGYDMRKLSREAARLIGQVLAANRIKVILSNRPLPTQAISYTVRSRRCTAGIMVTASHNPPHFNGIKIKDHFGRSAEKEITNKIEGLIGKNKPQRISLQKAKGMGGLKIENLVKDYLRFASSYVKMPLLKRGCLNVLCDPMHGAANSYVAEILKHTPHKVTTIHAKHDFTFGGVKPEPIPACLKETTALMRKGKFDICLVCDGDADRIAALDEKGRFISPQQIIGLLLLHLICYRKMKGAVVKTISGTSLLDKISQRFKLKLYETPVGFKYISSLMQKKDILIGGEEGGGIGFKNYLLERDGITAGLLLLEMIIANKKSIAQLLKEMRREFGSFVYLRRDVHCPPAQKERVSAKLAKMRKQKTFFGSKIAQVKDSDGLKFYLDDGSWVLFRLSGTEPILRIYAEAESAAKTSKIIAEGIRMLNL